MANLIIIDEDRLAEIMTMHNASLKCDKNCLWTFSCYKGNYSNVKVSDCDITVVIDEAYRQVTGYKKRVEANKKRRERLNASRN
jgi:hypothetical protein